MASLAFEHVEKIYPGGTRAIVDLNLEVADGELVVLVGPSGCGKSTLLRVVAGLESVTGGTLRIGDRVANDLSPRERNVAMVFQDYALYPHKTVRGNLEFPLRMRGLARDEIAKRVAWAADVLDIATVLERLPRQLSGGQQQRVAMGRALVREPTVFLLDEPLSNLDAKLRVEVRAEIAELQRRMRATMLYVTHDQTEAMTLGHRVAVLKAGRVLQIAPPRELYERPADAFVASFIGNPPMNLLRAKVVARDSTTVRLAVAGGTLEVAAASAFAHALGGDGEEVVFGIRPEAFVDARDGGDGGGAAREVSTVRAVVEHVEWLGHETLVHVRLGDADAAGDGGVGASVEPDSLTQGSRASAAPELRAGDARRGVAAADDVSAATPSLVARLPGLRELERGQPLELRVAASALHVFTADGRAVEVGSKGV